MPKAVVIGAGVIGLCSAILLQESGYEVEIVAEKITPCTTSDVAAAIWEPYIAEPKAMVNKWSFATWDVIKRELETLGFDRTGLNYREGYQFYLDHVAADPEWASAVPYFIKYTHADGLSQRYKDGRKFKTIVVETHKYLPYLMGRFQLNGGKIRSGVKLTSLLNEYTSNADVIINCSGSGAFHMLADSNVSPVRGLLVKVDAPWVKNFYFEGEGEGTDLAYIIPRSDGIICGGTAYKGDWKLDLPDDQQAAAILERCNNLCPGIKDAPVLGRKVGLRPWRTAIRLEPEVVTCPTTGAKKLVVHNYGHGGSGYTVCWGCAQSVLKIVKDLTAKASTSRL